MLADALALLQALSSLSPLGVIALLGVVIWMLVRNQRGQQQIAENHLHDLPEVVELLRAQTATLARIEAALRPLNDHLVYIRARVNGSDR